MLNRICTYPIFDDHRTEEIETIKNIATVNGNGKKFMDQMYQHHLKKKQLHELTTLTPASDEQTIKRVPVLFHPPITSCFQETSNKNGPQPEANLVNFLETKSRHSKNRATIKLIVWDVLPPTLDNPDAASQ
jgi:hypothetical protein